MTYVNFKLATDADGIALVTWDAPGRSMTVIDMKVMEELGDIVDKVAGDAAIKGAVITSGKDTFCAGADLTMLEFLAREYVDYAREQGEEAAIARVLERAGAHVGAPGQVLLEPEHVAAAHLEHRGEQLLGQERII